MRLLKKYNLALLILPILIFSLGFVTLLSASVEEARTQLLFFLQGYLLYLLVSSIDYKLYKQYWYYLYFFTLAFLVLTFILGEVRYGSARWVDIGFLTFQPSELSKFALVVTCSSLIVLTKGSISSLRSLAKILFPTIPIFILVFIQPDLGTTLITMLTVLGILFYAGLNKWYFFILFLLGGTFSSPIWHLLQDYQKERILVFINPALDVLGSGYNVIQSLIAVGSGGLWGKGFGQGTQTHHNFLPAHWTDFAFASFAEEWGFVGVVLLIGLITMFLLGILYVALNSGDAYGALLSIGVFTVFLSQFIINVGMNLGVMPVTGIPLPFVSYGGSSLFTSMLLLGVVQSVWSGRKQASSGKIHLCRT